MSNNASRPFIPLNGGEIKRLILQRVEDVLNNDTRLANHLAYPQVALSVGIRMVYYPMDAGPIEHAIPIVLGEASAGSPNLEPPDAVAEQMAAMTDGHVVLGARGGTGRAQAIQPNTSRTPGVRSYGTGPVVKRGDRPSPSSRDSVTEQVQTAIRRTEPVAVATRTVPGRGPQGPKPTVIGDPALAGSVDWPDLPGRDDTAIDVHRLQIDGDGARTVRHAMTTGAGEMPGDKITGGAAPMPAGIAAIIAERQAPDRAAAEAVRLRNKLAAQEAMGGADPALIGSTVVTHPNDARRDAGLPVPSVRTSSRGGVIQMSDAVDSEF